MRHLAEDTAVRRGDALDRAVGAVHVPLLVHRDVAERIGILGRDLAVLKELLQPCVICDKAALAVGCRRDIDAAEVCIFQPRRLVGHDLRVDHSGDMSADRVECQCRSLRVLADDLAARHKTELDERLEAVADTECKAVAVI